MHGKYFWRSGLRTCFRTDCLHSNYHTLKRNVFLLFCDRAWKQYPMYIVIRLLSVPVYWHSVLLARQAWMTSPEFRKSIQNWNSKITIDFYRTMELLLGVSIRYARRSWRRWSLTKSINLFLSDMTLLLKCVH